MQKKYDVIISGAGPAGSLLGLLLAQDKIKTLLIEKEEFPRKKVCAGGLQHRVLSLIPFGLGDLLEGEIQTIRFSRHQKGPFTKKSSQPMMYTVQRTLLDDLMAKKANDAGCDILFGTRVKSIRVCERQVDVRTSGASYACKTLVGADGANGLVHRLFMEKGKYLKIIGYESDVLRQDLKAGSEILQDSDGTVWIDFGCVKRGYLWVFPKKDSFSIGSGGPYKRPAALKDYLKRFLAEHVSREARIDAHFIPVGNRQVPVASDRAILIGDAACLGDGFTGEGLYNALRSSHIAHDCIKEALEKGDYAFERYRKTIQKEIIADIRASLFFSKIFFSSSFFYYKLLQSNDVFFDSCCKILRGEKTYQSIIDKIRLLKTNRRPPR